MNKLKYFVNKRTAKISASVIAIVSMLHGYSPISFISNIFLLASSSNMD